MVLFLLMLGGKNGWGLVLQCKQGEKVAMHKPMCSCYLLL
jgi:hypothetical protein